MAFVHINPQYQDLLEQEGLVLPEDFLGLPGVIICGHPDRHVARVKVGGALPAYLKREHRVPLRDRLASAWAGSGFVSKSCRESLALQALHQAGVSCPEWLAAGEDDAGRAFLLTRALTGAADLRTVLRDQAAEAPTARRRLAVRLGETLAHLHDAGFDHPDLHSKHVFVDSGQDAIYLLDCQRTSRRLRLGWPRRWHNLAALDATLAEHLASPRDRLAFLQAYLRATLPVRAPRPFLAEAVRRIRAETVRLLRRRYIREVRQARLVLGTQNLIWLDGEALCVTREFRATWRGAMPGWLVEASQASRRAPGSMRSRVDLPDGSRGDLVCRRRSAPFRWLWCRLRSRPLSSPELRQAGMLFRLQRFGVGAPRLLAVGERHTPRGRTDSFLLTEAVPGVTDLAAWLADRAANERWTAERKQRWRLVHETAAMLRALHEANCHFRSSVDCPILVQPRPGGTPGVLLRGADEIRTVRHPSPRSVEDDLILMRRWLAPATNRTDQCRFLLLYLGLERWTPAAKDLARALLRPSRGGRL
jgi:hypothetical protein